MDVKKGLVFVALFIITLYIPLFLVVYVPYSYSLNYELTGVYDHVDEEGVREYTLEVVKYFLHYGDLGSNWSEEERLHFKDVRMIYDLLFFLVLIEVFVLVLSKNYDGALIRKFAMANIVLVLFVLVFAVSSFAFFWDKVFHPLIFSNDYWVYGAQSVSSMLFSYDFFRNIVVFVCSFMIVENLILFYKNRDKLEE